MKFRIEPTSDKIRIFDPGEMTDDTSEKKSPDFSDSLCYMCWDGGKPRLFLARLETH
jgi:hypothetical protein